MLSRRGEVSLWCLREIFNLDSAGRLRSTICAWHGWDLLTALSNVLGGKVCIVSSVSLDSVQSLACLFRGDSLQLLGLLSNNVGCMLVLRIDELLVLGIDERDEECDRGCEKSKSPAR